MLQGRALGRKLLLSPKSTGLMYLSDRIVEARIAEARDPGEFHQVPGVGTPPVLHHEPMAALELRSACPILNHTGCLPPEVGGRREIARLETLLRGLDAGDADRVQLGKRLDLLRAESRACGRGLPVQRTCAAPIHVRLDAPQPPLDEGQSS